METPSISKNDWVLLNFLDFEKSLNGGSKLPLHTKRKEAFAEFTKKGFPTPQMEEWKYTNVAPIREGGFTLAEAPTKDAIKSLDISTAIIPDLSCYSLVLVDGYFVPELSKLSGLPNGVHAASLVDAQKGDGAEHIQIHLGRYASVDEHFVALNTSFIKDGAIFYIPRGVVLDKPLHVISYTTASAAKRAVNQRVLVIAEANSEASIIETYIGTKNTAYFSNSVVECVVKENAKLDHYRIQQESTSSYHISTIQAELENSSRFRTHTFSFGGKLVRNNVNAVINGSGCDVTMNGLSVLTGDQHVDNSTLLDHAKPHCESHELYKGIYGDRSQGVFSGSIIVRPDAQKTNAIQSNRSLLLTDEASVNTKPQLKIWADDVKCTHGATIGQLDDDALFYIRSRGISENEARGMLIHAFASEVNIGVEIAPLKAHLETLLLDKLGLEG